MPKLPKFYWKKIEDWLEEFYNNRKADIIRFGDLIYQHGGDALEFIINQFSSVEMDEICDCMYDIRYGNFDNVASNGRILPMDSWFEYEDFFTEENWKLVDEVCDGYDKEP